MRVHEPVVSLQGVGKVYTPTPRWMRFLVRTTIREDIVALEDIHLDVGPGETCAVVGPNGAGKTTLFRILAGLTTPSSGSATVCGFDAHHESDSVRRRIGWMPAEERSLFMRLDCVENLYFHGRLQRMPKRQLLARIDEVLDQVGLGAMARNSVFGLSSGMRARLQLARAILHRPKLLLLDEPTGPVDPVGAHELLSLITDLVRSEQLAALISSHRLEEIEALGSNVVLLDRGRVRYQGDLEDLRRRYDSPRVLITLGSAQAADHAALSMEALGTVHRLGDQTVVVELSDEISLGDALIKLQDLTPDIVRLSEHPLPLREILVRLYRSRETASAKERGR